MTDLDKAKQLEVTISEYPSELAPSERLRLVLTVHGYEVRRVLRSGRVPLKQRIACRDIFDAYPYFVDAGRLPGGVQFCDFNGNAFPEPIVVHDLAAVVS
jgi:hypothetical protein